MKDLQEIKNLREKGNDKYFALDAMTNEELVYALRLSGKNTSLENIALVECILERMSK